MVVCDMVLLWLTLIRKEKTLKSMPLFIIVKLRPETEILSCLWHTSLCEQDKISHWFCFWQKLCNRLLIMRLGPREILIYNLGLNTDWTIVICSLCLKEITMLVSFYLFIFCKQMQCIYLGFHYQCFTLATDMEEIHVWTYKNISFFTPSVVLVKQNR